MSRTIRVLLADDHAVLRAGLKVLLEAESDIAVVGEAADGLECVNLASETQPDVILLDINMPNCNGLEALKDLRQRVPESHVLILTMHDDEGYLRQVLTSGGSGYVLKQSASEELLSAIRAVNQGGTYLQANHTKVLLEHALNQGQNQSLVKDDKQLLYQSLSERETQVLKLVALGYRNGEIAKSLHLSVKTVETYKTRLMQKLELRSRATLVRFALDLGILQEDLE